MTITLDLAPDIEQRLLAQARAKGVSITNYVEQLVAREARQTPVTSTAPEAKNMVELFANSPFNGLNIDFGRDRDYGRDVDL